jgi:malonyl-CoA reductase/3-hydroxypropionate dehydrogenase (NADP+)
MLCHEPEKGTLMTTSPTTSPELAQRLRGLHHEKVALITGGSVGIGAALGRLLALSGARVLLAARSPGPLEETRARIVAELAAAGFPEPERRVLIEADCDVGRPADMERLAATALAAFGHVDYLINNAGVVGAEDMVIDMPIDGWRQCLQANMNSNYALIRALAPRMKERGEGHVINVSSYFGGEKYVAIAYPNRADYAVSKAGQRAMVEALARFLGPEIQINAVAPGPVDGDRLRGTADRPSMFQRRARVILENRRLGEVYAALIHASREGGVPVADLLPAVVANDVRAVMGDESQPARLRKLAATIWAQSDSAGGSRAHFLSERLAKKLLRRLTHAGQLGAHGPAAHPPVAAPEPFFTQAEYEREGGKVGDRILGMMHLRRVPTNDDVALSTIYHLADRYVTGETFHTTGGLRFERAVTEGELFGKPNPARLARLRGATVYLVGERMTRHLERLTTAFLDEQGAGRVVLITESAETAAGMLAAFPQHTGAGRLVACVAGSDLEGALETARHSHGPADAVVSTPFRPLPAVQLAPEGGDWSGVLSAEGFVELVEQQLTHHVRVAQRVATMDGARLVLVTPDTTARSSEEEFALANFVKTTLHSFTATLGAECERLCHYTAVNQVDLTRRARDEEPRTAAEEAEELERFVEAVLLTSVPLPSPEESRYRARIYRGNAITV